MPTTLQTFIRGAIEKTRVELVTALLRLPEDKRNWSPMGSARTALDMVAECAILHGTTAGVIRNRAFDPSFDFGKFGADKAALAEDWPKLQALLESNAAAISAAIMEVPDEDLNQSIAMPWGPMPLADLIAYPYWNMSYHLGQINYLASMLNCLD